MITLSLKVDTVCEKMKASPTQIFKEAEILKASLAGEDLWLKRQELCHLLESLLLIDLDYALDKKVEQDLWSYVFRNPISAYQSKVKEHKKANCSNNQLPILLEAASGFYLQLLQKLCCEYDIDLPCHPRDSVYGMTKEWSSKYSIAHQPRKSSLLYICQHCLVHLGDIARYRGQSLQAETFYRHAVELVPSNGQPYNQLALLEAASGEKLSTAYFYVRSLCVQHPFPLAATNLHNLFVKMASDGSSPEGKSRLSAFEYVSVFLQFHSIIHLSNLKNTESLVSKLSTSLPALIIAEKFETWQLVQMAAVCLFAIEHVWGTINVDSTHFDEAMLSPEERKASSLVEELLATMLHALLLPVHASLEPKETSLYYTLPAIKVILDWLVQDPQLLQHGAINRNPQLWHSLCKLLNDLDVITKEPFDIKKLEDMPLPEDWDLQSFLPLKKSQRQLKFCLKNTSLSDEEYIWLRSVRLCKLGEALAGATAEGLLSLSLSDGKRVFKAVHHTESLSDEVLQQIQELTLHPSDMLATLNGNTSEGTRSKTECVPQQEVRFKLDDSQQRKSDNEVPERRFKETATTKERRQNVAMKAILQQRAAQMSSGVGQESGMENNTMLPQNCRSHLDNMHLLEPDSENCSPPPSSKEGGAQQCEVWQQYNMHPAVNQVSRENPMSNFVQGVVCGPNFNYQQPSQMIKANLPPPNMLWNYMGFVAPTYQQAPAQPQVLLQQSQSQRQLGFYVVNGIPSQDHLGETSLLHATYSAQEEMWDRGDQMRPQSSAQESSTYSLFNSPGIQRAASKDQQNSIDPVFMQSRIQSLWSGPGPSPLERLLEQQKQRRETQ